jgi:hypothetical protein
MPPEQQVNAIWKFELDVDAEQTIETPQVWEPLHVGYQDNRLVLWAEVDSRSKMVERTIGIRGTGIPLPNKHWQWLYIGTVQSRHGFVWHVYWKALDREENQN